MVVVVVVTVLVLVLVLLVDVVEDDVDDDVLVLLDVVVDVVEVDVVVELLLVLVLVVVLDVDELLVVVVTDAASNSDSSTGLTEPPPPVSAVPTKLTISVSSTSHPNRGPGSCNWTPNVPARAAKESSKIVWFSSGRRGDVPNPTAPVASSSVWLMALPLSDASTKPLPYTLMSQRSAPLPVQATNRL